MRIAQLIERHRFQLVEGPVVEPGPGEVQVRVAAVGVCGSDLHYFSDGGIGDTPSQYPMVLGHEPAGTVVKTGTGVTGWTPGDKAVLEPAIYCYHCEFCSTGHHNVCANLRFLSQPGDPGFFREYVNLPVRNLAPLPAGLSLREATLFEPLAVILHSMEFASIRPAETAVVFGAGPIGLLTIAVVRLSGASRIWAVEPVAHRRELALALGADAAIDPSATDPVRDILAETGKRGADVAIDCVARGNSINQAIHLARNAGRVVVTGIPAEVQVSLDYHVMRRKELGFFNVRRSVHENEAALDLLREKPSLFTPMLTHNRSLDQIQQAFNMLERYEDGVGKLVIDVG
jgi:L-iditol 2-dehydrogenase